MSVQVVCLAWLPCDAGSLAVTTIELIALYCDIRNAKIRPPQSILSTLEALHKGAATEETNN